MFAPVRDPDRWKSGAGEVSGPPVDTENDPWWTWRDPEPPPHHHFTPGGQAPSEDGGSPVTRSVRDPGQWTETGPRPGRVA